MRLNVGAGDLPAPTPWLNVDAQPSTSPDIVASVTALPFGDASVSHVYCGHVLEHVRYEDELPTALAELRRVLVDAGRLCVVGPDYDRALDWGDDVLLQTLREGGSRWAGDRHEWLSTEAATLDAMRSVFPTAQPVPIAEVPDPWPVSFRVGWQFAILT